MSAWKTKLNSYRGVFVDQAVDFIQARSSGCQVFNGAKFSTVPIFQGCQTLWLSRRHEWKHRDKTLNFPNYQLIRFTN